MTRQYNNLPEIIHFGAERYKDKAAVATVGKTPISYRQYADMMNRISSFLLDSGISRGDRVALISENQPHWGIIYLAVQNIGAVIVPLLSDFSASQIANILDHAEVSYGFYSEPQKKKIAPYFAQKGIKTALVDTLCEESTSLLNASPLSNLPQVGLEDLAAILYTSGTTGNSKGVMLSHGNLVSNTIGGVNVAELNKDDITVSILPLAHTYECTFGFLAILMAGGTVNYIEGKPVPSSLMKAFKLIRPTVVLSVPLLMEKIYKSSIKPVITGSTVMKILMKIKPIRILLSRLVIGKRLKEKMGGRIRFFGIGGAPLMPDVELFLIESGFPYSIGYGLTETAPLIAGGHPRYMKYRSTGKVLEGVTVRINSEEGKSTGEIQVKGPNVMKGYYKDSERTSGMFTEDGWFKTGDLGYLSKKSVLYIKGRLKNMILGSNGENIYPEDLEAVINQNSFVSESLAFLKGKELVARIHLNTEQLDKLKEDLKMTNKQLNQYKEELMENIRIEVNRQVGNFSRISHVIEQLTPFEKTPSLKIKRFLYTQIGLAT